MDRNKKYQEMVNLCLEKYRKLSKRGKPVEGQWTTLCGLISEENDRPRLIALTTGTKCVTRKPAQVPNALIDCHAEVLCKRAFKAHLMDRLEANRPGDGVDRLGTINWHIFISQLPCGVVDRYQGSISKQETNSGIHRKPGRGESCPEASCIDKILKWGVLGIQGKRLIGLTRRPIILSSIITGNCSQEFEYDADSLRKSMNLGDSNLSAPFNLNFQPEIHFIPEIRCDPFIRRPELQASPSAIVCWEEKHGFQTEIVVEGLKQGVNKKCADSNPLRISQKSLKDRFNMLIDKYCDYDGEIVQKYEETWEYMRSLPRFKGWKISTHKICQSY